MDDLDFELRPPPKPPFPGFAQACWLVALLIVAQALLLALMTERPPAGGSLDMTAEVVPLIAASLLSFALVMWVGLRRSGRPLRETLPFTHCPPSVMLPALLALVGLGIVASEIDNLTRWLIPPAGWLTEMTAAMTGISIPALLALAVVAPVTEELLFRGLILKGFLARYRPLEAMVYSAALFSLTHFNPYQFLASFAMGLLLAWMLARTGSLLPCFFSHAFFNTQGFMVQYGFGWRIPGYSDDSGLAGPVTFQPEWLDALGVALLGIGVVLLHYMMPRRRASAGGERAGD